MGLGWDATLLTDKTFLSDYRLSQFSPNQTLSSVLRSPDYALSQLYLAGRGERSYFDARTMYFYGFSSSDVQGQIPLVLPVIDHDYTLDQPILGGELSFHNNLTAISRQSANFDPISSLALSSGLCTLNTADRAPSIGQIVRCAAFPHLYALLHGSGLATDLHRPYGQMFTPFASLRGDVASVQVLDQPGVSNYINPGSTDVARAMPTVGLEYKYPFINVQSWGTQTIEPTAQVILRPNESQISALPNEDAQSLLFDDSNLFKVNKFSGWDRVEAAAASMPASSTPPSSTAQATSTCCSANPINCSAELLHGRRAHQYRPRQRPRHLPVRLHRACVLPAQRGAHVHVTVPVRSGQFCSAANGARDCRQFWPLEHHGDVRDYAAQPSLGLDHREGILANGRYKFNENWVLLGGPV